MRIENGLFSAIGCSQPTIISGSTNAEEMNVSGNIQMNPAEFAASTEPTERPIHAAIQLKA